MRTNHSPSVRLAAMNSQATDLATKPRGQQSTQKPSETPFANALSKVARLVGAQLMHQILLEEWAVESVTAGPIIAATH